VYSSCLRCSADRAFFPTLVRILFGPAHDALHVDPAAPGVYEWWYFDALSDDGRFVLVAIFFLGTPMSPYYKAVARGKTMPDARNWCGVFVSVHERVAPECWRERAYAYNVYAAGGAFSPTLPEVTVGGSRIAGEETAPGWNWQVAVDEPGLWTGRTKKDLTFTAPGAGFLDAVAPLGAAADAAAHTWVCVAPVCRAEGTVTLPSGKVINFRGSGYHDHNFGRLPFDDTDLWYWGRAPLACDDGRERTAVFYHLQPPRRRLRPPFRPCWCSATGTPPGRRWSSPRPTFWAISRSRSAVRTACATRSNWVLRQGRSRPDAVGRVAAPRTGCVFGRAVLPPAAAHDSGERTAKRAADLVRRGRGNR
jgi:hypothetical protein